MAEFWKTANAESKPLTREMLLDAFAAIEKRDEEYRRAPKGPCGCPNCLVSPKTKARLEREGGGAICASCGRAFWVDTEGADRD